LSQPLQAVLPHFGQALAAVVLVQTPSLQQDSPGLQEAPAAGPAVWQLVKQQQETRARMEMIFFMGMIVFLGSVGIWVFVQMVVNDNDESPFVNFHSPRT
jgi:hypothetical protein